MLVDCPRMRTCFRQLALSHAPILLIYLGYSMDPAARTDSTVEVGSGGSNGVITLSLGSQDLAHKHKKAEM